jgi:hypothetical protein
MPSTVVQSALSIGTLRKPADTTIELDFKLSCRYSPEIGSIDLAGTAILLANSADVESQKQLQEIVDRHSQGMQPPVTLTNKLLDFVFPIAVILAHEAGLPSPQAVPSARE